MSRILPTLNKRRSPLASGAAQRAMLARVPLSRSFGNAIRDAGVESLQPARLEILQINVGKKCNQTCRHCHVDAGPDRTEIMPDEVMDRCLDVLASTPIPTLDITGGAPELHPRFRELVRKARSLDRRVIDRCNLTILLLPNYRDLAGFLAEHQVEVTASLPHYRPQRTDAQRGQGVFDESIEALRRLNALGYGASDSGLVLNLVTNPVGAFLPGSQAALERDWKRELDRRYGVTFNQLFTITNMPISRFLQYLEDSENLTSYMQKLSDSFNPAAVANLMCRDTLSVGWDGTLYDCDFNQMLDLPVNHGSPRSIFDFDPSRLATRTIASGPHCFGCTAGAGSSCGGALA